MCPLLKTRPPPKRFLYGGVNRTKCNTEGSGAVGINGIGSDLLRHEIQTCKARYYGQRFNNSTDGQTEKRSIQKRWAVTFQASYKIPGSQTSILCHQYNPSIGYLRPYCFIACIAQRPAIWGAIRRSGRSTTVMFGSSFRIVPKVVGYCSI